jgi:hypothetical protein
MIESILASAANSPVNTAHTQQSSGRFSVRSDDENIYHGTGTSSSAIIIIIIIIIINVIVYISIITGANGSSNAGAGSSGTTFTVPTPNSFRRSQQQKSSLFQTETFDWD